MEWIVGGVVVLLVITIYAIKRAPTCVCHQKDCGGGCLKRSK